MRKTLCDMARHMKHLILHEIPDTYAINPIFEDIASEECIRKGVLVFRDFLYKLCDILIAEGDAYDNKKKIAHAFDNRSAISVHYPFLHNIGYLLMNIGISGMLTDDAGAIAAEGTIFNQKLSASKNMQCLRFLSDCGLCFGGLDLHEKKPDFTTTGLMTITYPENPAMLTGLKVMAIAHKKFWSNDCTDIFLRCDYRVIKKEKTEAVSILKDTIQHLSGDIQDYLLKLHQRYLDKGLSCDIKIKDYWVKIYYSCRKKEIWAINASLNNGYQISVKAENAHKYASAVEKFPLYLQEMMAKGYCCGKKSGISSHCDGGCRGLRIPLDDSVLDISDVIEIWFDNEISYL